MEREECKILINISDVNQVKAFHGLTTEECMNIFANNVDLFSNRCPDLCELDLVIKQVLNK